jgi:glycosyltransferase involved in cell wall biosynthesis
LRTKTYSGIREFLGLKALSLLEGYSTRRADRVIAISGELYTRIRDEMHINPDRIDIVHHAVDTTKYRCVDSDVRQRLEISPDIPLVLFVGRLEARKGVDVLCQAIPEVVKRIPEAMFLFIGRDTNTASESGSMRSHLLKEATNGGFFDRVRFLDFMPPDELVSFYSACDVFVLPSFQEGSSMAIIEAMACGRPVVATATGSVTELNLDGTNGIAVPAGDVSRLAEAVVKLLLLSEGEKRVVAERNRELVEREFAISRWVEEVLEVYEKALDARVN